MTTAIDVRDVGKKFEIPAEKVVTLYETLTNQVLGRNRYEDFWALKNISFKVEKGESLGVIGGNGSGKSTLLKLIANILRPTTGAIKVQGRITSFLELGIGFQQDLTARENVYLYGKIMGLRSREINQKVEEIIKFSDLERFIDAKLRNFSSGMQVRLAFATAIQTDPEILLVDEVLAVGDMGFQQKCFDYFNRYTSEGKTMVFVTHDLTSVRRFCNKTILLRNGELSEYGQTGNVIDKYIYDAQKIETAKEKIGERWGTKKAIITDVEFIDKFGKITEVVNSGDPLTIRIRYQTKELIQKPVFGIAIHNEQGTHIYGTNTQLKGYELRSINDKGHIDFVIDRIPMSYGRHYTTVALHTTDHIHHDWRNKEYQFNVVKNNNEDGIISLSGQWRL
jgi:lipopolysaccharide transport system ATP-binding protein